MKNYKIIGIDANLMLFKMILGIRTNGYDIKNAAHVIRLYRMGIEYLESGNLQVFRPDREELKAIKIKLQKDLKIPMKR